ncbi:MAG: energy-coupling factor transporter ATPase [Tissierellales bacterium]|nr:energy-coupling factor transporter ATPase [Tissierellales bacterium]
MRDNLNINKENIIEIKNVSFKYGEEENLAVKNINLNIKAGEFVSILGHNGSGKSTLAKLINSILLPFEGEVLVKGMNTKDKEKLWEIRSTAGMVFQNPDNQLVGTVVEEDVAFGPENQGVDPILIRQIVDESLKKVDMYEFRKRPPHLLSGGQKQRIAIAGVLALNSDCIILDEPTAMLDPEGREEVMDTIKRLNKEQNKTIVLITHFMDEAVEADRVIIMDEGELKLDGEPRYVFSKVEEIKRYGLDVPQVTELSKELKKEGIKLSDNIIHIEELVSELCQ